MLKSLVRLDLVRTHNVWIPWSPKAGGGCSTHLAIPSGPLAWMAEAANIQLASASALIVFLNSKQIGCHYVGTRSSRGIISELDTALLQLRMHAHMLAACACAHKITSFVFTYDIIMFGTDHISQVKQSVSREKIVSFIYQTLTAATHTCNVPPHIPSTN